ncbi:MAG: hypothetical protein HYZ81_18065 [Nitrospinae bacterium]|nr:hypothetical protein [Nitrospinota bacterium]
MRRNPCRLIVVAAGLAVCLIAVGQAWARSVEEVIAAVRASTARYLDITKAGEDGFVQISDMEPHHGYHFLNVNAQILSAAARFWSSELDLSKPPMLLYVERESVWQLAGIYLFFHFYDGAFHLDWIYLQHAVMGLTSLGVGVTLLLDSET